MALRAGSSSLVYTPLCVRVFVSRVRYVAPAMSARAPQKTLPAPVLKIVHKLSGSREPSILSAGAHRPTCTRSWTLSFYIRSTAVRPFRSVVQPPATTCTSFREGMQEYRRGTNRTRSTPLLTIRFPNHVCSPFLAAPGNLYLHAVCSSWFGFC